MADTDKKTASTKKPTTKAAATTKPKAATKKPATKTAAPKKAPAKKTAAKKATSVSFNAAGRYTKNDLNQTIWVKPGQMQKERVWYTVDAAGQTLGRLAVTIARKLIGKDKAHYCDFRDAGDHVIVTNVQKIETTGYKQTQKKYYRYSGYKGNVKSRTLKEMLAENPERVLRLAVRGMLPKNKLRKQRMKRLKLIVGETSQYNNQQTQPLLS